MLERRNIFGKIFEQDFRTIKFYKLFGMNLNNDFFDEFRKDVKKIYNEDINIRTKNSYQNFMTGFSTEPIYFSFTISRFHGNCGALVASGIDYPYDELNRLSGMEILDRLMVKLAKRDRRTAIYYTVSHTQRRLTEALIKYGWRVMDKTWTNNNGGNTITTLIRVI